MIGRHNFSIGESTITIGGHTIVIGKQTITIGKQTINSFLTSDTKTLPPDAKNESSEDQNQSPYANKWYSHPQRLFCGDPFPLPANRNPSPARHNGPQYADLPHTALQSALRSF